jgi:hypothetical protein
MQVAQEYALDTQNYARLMLTDATLLSFRFLQIDALHSKPALKGTTTGDGNRINWLDRALVASQK